MWDVKLPLFQLPKGDGSDQGWVSYLFICFGFAAVHQPQVIFGAINGTTNTDVADVSVTRSHSTILLIRQPIIPQKGEGHITYFRFKGGLEWHQKFFLIDPGRF